MFSTYEKEKEFFVWTVELLHSKLLYSKRVDIFSKG